MDEKKQKEQTTRRVALKRTIMAVPTIVTFAVTDLKAQASRPRPYTPIG